MNPYAVLWPELCLGCSTPGATFCPRCCGSALVRVPPDLCHVCGKLARSSLVHRECQELTSLDGVFAVYVYNQLLAKALFEVKYSFKHQLLRCLMPDAQMPLPAVDMVVPVPLAARRLRWRGFNQAAHLANLICQISEAPLVANGLQRRVFKHSQVGTGRQERLQNLAGAFEVNAACDICNKRVLLVDDVMTTGATLEACAAALRRAGAAQVYAFVLGRDLVATASDATP